MNVDDEMLDEVVMVEKHEEGARVRYASGRSKFVRSKASKHRVGAELIAYKNNLGRG